VSQIHNGVGPGFVKSLEQRLGETKFPRVEVANDRRKLVVVADQDKNIGKAHGPDADRLRDL